MENCFIELCKLCNVYILTTYVTHFKLNNPIHPIQTVLGSFTNKNVVLILPKLCYFRVWVCNILFWQHM